MPSRASSVNRGPCQPDTFYCNWTSMLSRVFSPSRTPIRFDVYIESNRSGTGLIGADQYMKYTERLRTTDAKPLSLLDKDFHVKFCHQTHLSLALRIFEFVLKKFFFFLQPSKQVEPPLYLPASILQDGKENDIFQFQWEGQLFEYRLKQTMHPHPAGKGRFEDHLQLLQSYFQNEKLKSITPYLFEEDILSHIIRFQFRNFTENAKLYSSRDKSLVPLNAANFDPLRKWLGKAASTQITLSKIDDNYRLTVDAPGVPAESIWIITDLNYVLILAQPKPLHLLDGIPLENTKCIYNTRSEYFSKEILLKEGNIDPKSLEFTCLHGKAYINLKLAS